MKIYIAAIIFTAFIASCDYSTSSNGNIDAAYAKEVQVDESEKEHEVEGPGHQVSREEKPHPGENTHQDVYDTSAHEQTSYPEGKVMATDTIPLGKRGQGKK